MSNDVTLLTLLRDKYLRLERQRTVLKRWSKVEISMSVTSFMDNPKVAVNYVITMF